MPEKAALARTALPSTRCAASSTCCRAWCAAAAPTGWSCALTTTGARRGGSPLLPSYKAHRLTPAGGEEVPDALSPQVPIIQEFLAALGITAVGAHGYEADDVIGTLATREPGPIDVVTGDRDLFQLVDDARAVTVLYCGRGVAKLEVVDNAALRAKYGVPGRPATPTSPRCAATRPTACPASPASARRPRRGSSTGTATSTGSSPPSTTPRPASPRASARRSSPAATYLTVARDVVAVARDVPLGDLDTELPAVPRRPGRAGRPRRALGPRRRHETHRRRPGRVLSGYRRLAVPARLEPHAGSAPAIPACR